jgi:hypothetical protein
MAHCDRVIAILSRLRQERIQAQRRKRQMLTRSVVQVRTQLPERAFCLRRRPRRGRHRPTPQRVVLRRHAPRLLQL